MSPTQAGVFPASFFFSVISTFKQVNDFVEVLHINIINPVHQDENNQETVNNGHSVGRSSFQIVLSSTEVLSFIKFKENLSEEGQQVRRSQLLIWIFLINVAPNAIFTYFGAIYLKDVINLKAR
jgi:hypothetical protein